MIFYEYVIFYYYILLLLIITYYYKLYNNSNDTLIISNKLNSYSCYYHNIYIINRKWYRVNNKKHKNNCYTSILSRKSNEIWKPIDINRKEYMKLTKKKYIKEINGYSIYFKFFFKLNVGHILWDDLYPIFLSMTKFGLNNKPFNIIIHKNDSDINNREGIKDLNDILKHFSMSKIIFENEFKNDIIRINNLIVGSAYQNQRYITKDYSIPGSKELNGLKLFRNRFYKSYNIKERKEFKNKLEIAIISNKRYTKNDLININEIIDILSKENKYNIYYFDYSKHKKFEDQIKIISNIDMYISSPGTGMMNFPFMKDNSILINLGGIRNNCPWFMEQYISNGCNYIQTLYYPSNKRLNGIKSNILYDLIKKGEYIIKNKLKKEINLSIEGEIFRNISINYPNIFNEIILKYDWCSTNTIGIWAEDFIYFPEDKDINGLVDVVNEMKMKWKNELGC